MIEPFILTLHSWNRWIVLIAGVVAIAGAVRSSRGVATPGDQKRALIFMIVTDIQLLLGLILYAVTPWIGMFASSPSDAMQSDAVRFWSIEHGFGMIVAIALVHLGQRTMKRAGESPRKARTAAIVFVLAIIIMVATIPWPFAPYGRPLFRF